MFKKLFYILLCGIFLTGCGKLDDKKQAVQSEISQVTENETTTAEDESTTTGDKSMTTENKDTDSNSTNSNASQNKDSANSQNNESTSINNDSSTSNANWENETGKMNTGEADNTNQTEETVETLAEQSQDEIAKKYALPEGFVYVDDVIPTVDLDIRYYTDYNFVGEKIDGYVAPLAILTTQATDALKVAADKLEADGYRIRIYDAYRPQKAVQNFVRWAQTDDASMKEVFYPSMEKAVLFKDGYISDKSRHSRGSTIDMTIVDKDGNEIDMGGYFDLLDTRSNYDTDEITQAQHENREYLKNIMDEAGFNSIRTEWWHFQLREEPYPDTYFDFDIE